MRETQASFWIPVLAGRDLGDIFIAERLVLAVPYVLVDNPMSYLGGRETYGYAKTMGRFDPPGGIGDHVTSRPSAETSGAMRAPTGAPSWR